MVNGESSRDKAKPDWVTDVDVGRHVCAILDAPITSPGPVLRLKSREQAGRPKSPLRTKGEQRKARRYSRGSRIRLAILFFWIADDPPRIGMISASRT